MVLDNLHIAIDRLGKIIRVDSLTLSSLTQKGLVLIQSPQHIFVSSSQILIQRPGYNMSCQFPGCSKPAFQGSSYCSKSHREYVSLIQNLKVIRFMYIYWQRIQRVWSNSRSGCSKPSCPARRLNTHARIMSVPWLYKTCFFRKYILLEISQRVRLVVYYKKAFFVEKNYQVMQQLKRPTQRPTQRLFTVVEPPLVIRLVNSQVVRSRYSQEALIVPGPTESAFISSQYFARPLDAQFLAVPLLKAVEHLRLALECLLIHLCQVVGDLPRQLVHRLVRSLAAPNLSLQEACTAQGPTESEN